jgi:hypothetical protein
LSVHRDAQTVKFCISAFPESGVISSTPPSGGTFAVTSTVANDVYEALCDGTVTLRVKLKDAPDGIANGTMASGKG